MKKAQTTLQLNKVLSDEFSSAFIKDFFDKNYTGKKYLFGLNPLAADFAQELNIDGFVTTKSRKTEFLGKKVVLLENVQTEDLVLVCETNGAAAVERLLAGCSFRHMDCFSFSIRTKSSVNVYHFSGWAEDIEKNFSKYQKIFSMLADEESKLVFYNLVNFKFSGDMRYLKDFEINVQSGQSEQSAQPEQMQYFEPFLNLPEKPVFVDAGGFTGDTTLQFIQKYPDYSAVYLFEPEPHFLKKAEASLKNYRNIVFIAKGLSDKKATVRFSSKGLASCIDKDGETEIETDTLDNCISVETKIDFIKMDIEGEESAAISGAAATIKKNRPVLAVCVYHKPDDFWKIPEQVLSIYSGYSIFMRHYSEVSDETVMFFIPR